MSRLCTVCSRTDKAEIDQALVAGGPYRSIAKLFDASPQAVYRHLQGHLPSSLTKAAEAKEIAEAGTLLDQVKDLQSKALSILSRAEQAGDLRTALIAIREGRSTLELLSKLTERDPQGDQPVQITRVTVVLPAGYEPPGYEPDTVEGKVTRVE